MEWWSSPIFIFVFFNGTAPPVLKGDIAGPGPLIWYAPKWVPYPVPDEDPDLASSLESGRRSAWSCSKEFKLEKT